MKNLLLFLFFFTLPTFATGINGASAPCDNATLAKYNGTADIEINWEPNTINLNWYDGDTKLTVANSAQSCVYDSTLTVPEQPTKPGYTFNGWKVIHVPGGFTELEYLRSTGSQYIEIGLKANLNTKVEIIYKWPEYTNDSFGYIFGCRDDQNTNAFLIGSWDARILSTTHLFAQFDSVSPIFHTQTYFDLSKHTVSLSRDGFYVDGVLNTSFANPTAFTTTKNLTLFARWHGSELKKGKIDIYSFSLWNNYSLVRHFIPARRDSDGVLGMYDTVTDTFFTNAGTGTFIAGPVVQ